MDQPKQTSNSDQPLASRWTRVVHGLLICLLLTALGIIFIAEYASRETVSATENRRLATWPELTQESVLDGSFARGIEAYVADHFPLRDYFTELATLVKTNRGLALDGRVVQVKGGESGFEDVNTWAKPQSSAETEDVAKEAVPEAEVALVTPGLDRETNTSTEVNERSDTASESATNTVSEAKPEELKPAPELRLETEPKPKPKPVEAATPTPPTAQAPPATASTTPAPVATNKPLNVVGGVLL
ncbi:MAG: hypothetical protein RI904_2654, partial [Pseudomonadota bacterium]